MGQRAEGMGKSKELRVWGRGQRGECCPSEKAVNGIDFYQPAV
jgi:hypothetical protein